MKIIVTQKDIDTGKSAEPCSCPIAKAIKRVLPSADFRVGSDHLFIKNRNLKHDTIMLSKEAIDFIASFDHGLSVRPFEFEIELKKD